MVGFTISLESEFTYNNCLFFVNNKVLYFHTLQTMHPPIDLPSCLSFLFLTIKKSNRKEKAWEQGCVGYRKVLSVNIEINLNLVVV